MEEYILEELLYYKDLDFLVEQDENGNSDDERWEKIRPIAEKDFKEHKKCRNPEEFETKNDFEMYKSSLYTYEMYYEWEHPEIQKQIEEYENEHNDDDDEEEDFLFGTPKDMNINSFEDFKEEVRKILMESLYPENVVNSIFDEEEDFLRGNYEEYIKDGYSNLVGITAFTLDNAYTYDSSFEEGLEAFNEGNYEEAYTKFLKTSWRYDGDKDCDESDANSLHYLGIMTLKGIYTEKDIPLGINFLYQAFSEGGIEEIDLIEEFIEDILKDEESKTECKKYLECLIEDAQDQVVQKKAKDLIERNIL